MNGAMVPEMQTVFLPASPAVRPITATLVRQIAEHGRRRLGISCRAKVAARLKAKFAGKPSLDRFQGAFMIRILAVAGCACLLRRPRSRRHRPQRSADPQNTLVLETTKGSVVIKLRTDLAPQACRAAEAARARRLLQQRAVPPRDGGLHGADRRRRRMSTARGGSKYPDLKQEFSQMPFKRGIVGMARGGHSVEFRATRQFFIMLRRAPHLNGQYTVIGEVVSGMDDGRQDQEGRAGRRAAPSPIPTR